MGEYIDKRLLTYAKLFTSLRKNQLDAVQHYVSVDSLPQRIKPILTMFVLSFLG
jgi:hypothetical protein